MASLHQIVRTERKVPKEVIDEIDVLSVIGEPYAAFDLDNTLLIGDIGEAVFASLVKKQLIKNFGWRDYIELVETNKLYAYKHIINLMQGLKLQVLEDITRKVIQSKQKHILLEGNKIPIPKPNQQMSSILKMLKKKGIPIYIVTASNEVSAQIICKKYFGIPASHIIGAEVACDKTGIIQTGIKEFPYGKGKVNILKRTFKNKPLVTGGDSPGDRYLLNYTAKGGIRFWLGNDPV